MVQNEGFVTVRVGKLPGRIEEIALNGDRTVTTALQAADLNPEGYEVRVNGAPAHMTTGLNQDDTVLLVRKIRGN